MATKTQPMKATKTKPDVLDRLELYRERHMRANTLRHLAAELLKEAADRDDEAECYIQDVEQGVCAACGVEYKLM